MHSLQGAIFSRKSKKWYGNKLGMLVPMMDEGSVMERAYFTVVPLTAVLRSISIAEEQINVPCPSRSPRVDVECVTEAVV